MPVEHAHRAVARAGHDLARQVAHDHLELVPGHLVGHDLEPVGKDHLVPFLPVGIPAGLVARGAHVERSLVESDPGAGWHEGRCGVRFGPGRVERGRGLVGLGLGLVRRGLVWPGLVRLGCGLVESVLPDGGVRSPPPVQRLTVGAGLGALPGLVGDDQMAGPQQHDRAQH